MKFKKLRKYNFEKKTVVGLPEPVITPYLPSPRVSTSTKRDSLFWVCIKNLWYTLKDCRFIFLLAINIHTITRAIQKMNGIKPDFHTSIYFFVIPITIWCFLYVQKTREDIRNGKNINVD